MPSKAERTAEFLDRMLKADAAGSAEEAYTLLCDTLNGVEDELTDIPFDSNAWATDGRIYPPQNDRADVEFEDPSIVRYRSRRHSTWIGANGAIRIAERGQICLEKPGHDGQTIQALMDTAQLSRLTTP